MVKGRSNFENLKDASFHVQLINTSRDYRNQMFAFTTSDVFDENLHFKTNSWFL